jgi:peptidoglycan hydrolase-like protein with peptidoglycan-binding domain
MVRASIAAVIVIGALLQACQSEQTNDASKPPQTPAQAIDESAQKAAQDVTPSPAESAATAGASQPAQADMPIDLRTAQMLLNKHGYKAGRADGKMGPRTRRALRRFQMDHGLTATGKLDRDTMNALAK